MGEDEDVFSRICDRPRIGAGSARLIPQNREIDVTSGNRRRTPKVAIERADVRRSSTGIHMETGAGRHHDCRLIIIIKSTFILTRAPDRYQASTNNCIGTKLMAGAVSRWHNPNIDGPGMAPLLLRSHFALARRCIH